MKKQRENPFARIGMSDKGVYLMPFSLRERAEQHELSRQRVVLMILTDLCLMKCFGYVTREMPLSLQKAVLQSLKGKEEEETEAAHCAPRQLLVSSQPLQRLLYFPIRNDLPPIPERAFALEMLFAETDILPANFNRADSRMEALGLSEAFLTSAKYVIHSELCEFGRVKAESVAITAKSAFSLYKQKAKASYLLAINKLKENLKLSFLFPEKRERYEQQLAITEKYFDILQSSDTAEKHLRLGLIEGLIKVYSSR